MSFPICNTKGWAILYPPYATVLLESQREGKMEKLIVDFVSSSYTGKRNISERK